MTDDNDLSPLRAANLRGAEDRVIAAVRARMAEHGVPAASVGPSTARPLDEALVALGWSARPILAASILLGVGGSMLIARTRDASPSRTSPPMVRASVTPSAATALGVDATVTRWVARPGEMPTAAELIATFRAR